MTKRKKKILTQKKKKIHSFKKHIQGNRVDIMMTCYIYGYSPDHLVIFIKNY